MLLVVARNRNSVVRWEASRVILSGAKYHPGALLSIAREAGVARVARALEAWPAAAKRRLDMLCHPKVVKSLECGWLHSLAPQPKDNANKLIRNYID